MIPLWQPTADGEILRNLRGVSEPFAYTSPGTPMAPLPESVVDLQVRWRRLIDNNREAIARRMHILTTCHDFAADLMRELNGIDSAGIWGRGHEWGDEWYAAAKDYANRNEATV